MDSTIFLNLFKRGKLLEYRLSDGTPLFMSIGRVGNTLSSHANSRKYLSGFFARMYLSLGQSYRAQMTKQSTIAMINPAVQCHKNVEFVEHDLFQEAKELENRFDVVRVANLLHSGYFPEERIALGIKRAASYVVAGGFLILARNVGQPKGADRELATIYRKKSNGELAVEARVGSGYDFEQLVPKQRAAQ